MTGEHGNLLVASELRKEFGGLLAVNDVDFVVPAQSIVSLIGPNGAGKTTFFNMLTGVYKPTAGGIAFDGEELTGKPPHAFTQRGIGRTFQNIRLFQNMTALENVLVGMHCRLTGGIIRSIIRTPGLQAGGGGRREARARAALVLGPRPDRGGLRQEPLVRRPAPARGRARARHRAEAPAPRRADRGHEPAGDRRLHRRSSSGSATTSR